MKPPLLLVATATLSLFLCACDAQATAPETDDQSVARIERFNLWVWRSGYIQCELGGGWIGIRRQSVPELRKLIAKAENWNKLALRENVAMFNKPLGVIEDIQLVFKVTKGPIFKDGQYTEGTVCLIEIGKNLTVTVEDFTSLVSALDKLPEIEKELTAIDAKFQ